MDITLEEIKTYLRLDGEDDDALIRSFIDTADSICREIIREDIGGTEHSGLLKTAMFYTVSYLYEHRENADFKELKAMLRNLLFGIRKEVF